MNISVELIRNSVLLTKDAETRTAILKKLISMYQTSPSRAKMIKGDSYYHGKHEILLDQKRINKITVNVNRLIVDQKVGYINLSGVKVGAIPNDGKKIKESEMDASLKELNANIQDQVDKKERLKLNNLHTDSASKGIEWLHYFINSEGEFDTKIINSLEALEVRDKEGQLDILIRFYLLDEWSVKDEEFDKLQVVEIWDREMSWVFKEIKQPTKQNKNATIFILDPGQVLNPCPHIIYSHGTTTLDHYHTQVNQKIKDRYTHGDIRDLKLLDFEMADLNVSVHGWGHVPFTPLMNNKDKEADLYYFKSLQDDLNKNVSDISNNFDDIQDIITFTKGFEELLEDNDGNQLDQVSAARVANYMIKQAKHINLPGGKEDNADIGFKTADIPVEKRYKHIEQLLSMMFMVAMAVSPQQLIESTVTTGVGITKLFSLLDIKANNNIAYIDLMLEDYGVFFTKFYNVVNETEYTTNNIYWQMSKNKLMNTQELVQTAVLLSQVVSKQTVVEYLPHIIVDDVTEELERQKSEGTVTPPTPDEF